MVAQGATTALFAVAMYVIIGLMPYPADTKAMLRVAILTLPMFLLYSLSAALLRAFERMQYLVYAEVLSSVAQIITAVVVLTVTPNVMALAGVRLAGLSLSAVVVLVSVVRMRLVRRPAIHLAFSWNLLRHSGDLFILAALDAILQQLDILSLSIVAGESVTGIYDAAFRLVQVLLTLVMSFTEAMYPILSRLYVEVATALQPGDGKGLAVRHGGVTAHRRRRHSSGATGHWAALSPARLRGFRQRAGDTQLGDNCLLHHELAQPYTGGGQ